jgi:uncharacterized protein (DUF779 family)
MEKNQHSLEVSLTEGALNFIKSLEMCNPQLLITLDYKRQFSGGCCGGGMSEPTPYLKVKLANHSVGEGFVELKCKAGIPVYISKSLYESIVKIGAPLMIDTKGFFKKTFVVSGVDVNNLVEADTPSKMRMDYH